MRKKLKSVSFFTLKIHYKNFTKLLCLPIFVELFLISQKTEIVLCGLDPIYYYEIFSIKKKHPRWIVKNYFL